MAYRINGKEVTREEFLRKKVGLRGGAPMVRPPGAWPAKGTMALAVHPDTVEEMRKKCDDLGVPTDFYREGYKAGPILRSRHHRREYVEKVMGMFDRDAGYSDPVPD